MRNARYLSQIMTWTSATALFALTACVGGETGSVSDAVKVVLSSNVSSVGATEGDTITLPLKLDVPPTTNMTLIWSLQKNDTVAPASLLSQLVSYVSGSKDFADMSGEVVVPAGSTSVNLKLQSLTDNLYEGTEIFTLIVSGENITGSLKVPITLLDSDSPPVLSAAPIFVNEGDTASLVFTLDKPSEKTITFKLQTLDDTAVSPANYTALTSSTIQVPPFSLTQIVKIPTISNPADNVNKRFFAVVSAPTNSTLSSAIVASSNKVAINIIDGVATVSPVLSVADVNVLESVGNASVTVTVTPPSSSTITFDWSLVSQTAQAGSDFTNVSGTAVTIPPNASSYTISIPIIDDTVNEQDETFLVQIANPTNSTLGRYQATVKIIDNDSRPSVDFALASSNDFEGSGGATKLMHVALRVTGVLGQSITVPFSISGTASNWTSTTPDYQFMNNSVTIAAGASAADIVIPVISDSDNEPDETVILTLGTLPTSVDAGVNTTHTFTIKNDDGPPAFSIGSVAVSEGTTMLIPVTKTGSSASAITVDYAISIAGLASPVTLTGANADVGTANVGLASLTGTVSFAAGETIHYISIPTVDDTLVEADEQLKVTISLSGANSALGTVTAGSDVSTNTIKDNDSLNISISGTAQATEGSPVVFNVCKTNPSATDFVVTYDTADITAIAGSDYTAVTGGSLTMHAANLCETISIATIDDSVYEADETFKVRLLTTAQGTLVTNSKDGIATIKDNDPLLTVEFAAASSTTASESGVHAVTVQLHGGAQATGTTTVAFTISGGTVPATLGTDYQLSSTQSGVNTTTKVVTFNAGDTSKVINFDILPDNIQDPGESFVLTLSSPTNATLSGATNLTHTVTITDANSTPSVQFAAASSSALEGTGSGFNQVAITVNLVGGTLGSNVTIPFTHSGTATIDDDYSLSSSSVTILAGQTSASILVSISKDSINEADETVILTLGSMPAGVVAGTTLVHTFTITNDDGTPALSVSAQTGYEGTNLTIPVTMVGSSASSITVNYTISTTMLANPTDLTGANADVGIAGVGLSSLTGTLTFASGETYKALSIPLLTDGLVEGDEQFQVTLSLSGANASLATITTANAVQTIKDADSLGLVITSTTQATEGAAMPFQICKTAAVVSNVTVTYKTIDGSATSPADYTGTNSGTVTLLPGDSCTSFTVPTIDDTITESDETFVVQLLTTSKGTIVGSGQATATIKDNDAPRTVGFDVTSAITATESGTQAVTVKLSQTAGTTITVNFGISAGSPAATLGTDYTIPTTGQATGVDVTGRTITFLAGEQTKIINFTIVDDNIVDPFEQFVVTLSSPTGDVTLGANTTQTVTIQDNDVAPIIESFTPAAGNRAAQPGTIDVLFNKQMSASTVSNTANWLVTCPGSVSLTNVVSTDIAGSPVKTKATLTLAGTSTLPSSCTIEAKLAIVDTGGNSLPSSSSNRSVTYNIYASGAITKVTSTQADGCYGTGTAITVQVYFSEAVTVTPGAGSAYPRMVLETGTVDAQVDLTAGSGTNILSGVYTVSPGHIVTKMSVNSLSLNTATIVGNVSGVTIASLTIPPGQSLDNLNNIGIDTIAPPTPTFASGSNGGDGVWGTSLTQSPPILFNVDSDVGCAGTVVYQSRANYSGTTFAALSYGATVPGNFTDGNTYSVILRAVDRLGNTSPESTTDGWIVDRTPPTTPTVPTLGATTANYTTTPTLSWTNSTDNGGSGVSYYQIQIMQSSYTGPIRVYPSTNTWATITKGQSIDLTATPLTIGNKYTFKVRAIDNAGNVGLESALSSEWTAIGECPTNFVKISANSALGTTKDFCVSSYEMRAVYASTGALYNNGAGVQLSGNSFEGSLSLPDGVPFSNIDAGNSNAYNLARTECNKLNGTGYNSAAGVGYDLIANAEWMTVARNAEARSENWSGGSVGSGYLPTGNSSGTPQTSTPSCLYVESGACAATGSFINRRSMKVTKADGTVGEVWDMAGNVEELVQELVVSTPPALSASGNYTWDSSLWYLCAGNSGNIVPFPGGGPSNNCSLSGTKYLPSNTTWTNPAQHIGYYDVSGQIGFHRGGIGATSGLYSLRSNVDSAGQWGFRCVYRLP